MLIASFWGLLSFSMFIMEEAIQTAMFGTWPAQDAGDWDLVLEGADIMESINVGLKVMVYTIGWLHPLAFFAYRSYSRSTDFYIRGLKAKIFARAPETFDGRVIEFNFTPQRVVEDASGIKLINRQIIVLTDKKPKYARLFIRGRVQVKDRKVWIQAIELTPVFSQN